MLVSLAEQLGRPRAQKELDGPALVVLLADPGLSENEPAVSMMLTQGPGLRVYPIFLADRVEGLPKGCSTIVELGGMEGRLVQAATGLAAPFVPDGLTAELAEKAARQMAAVRLQRLAGPGEISATVPLLDLLGVRAVAELDAVARWQAAEPFSSLAAPIGRKAGGEPVLLDLHEKGHGPHGLMAGTTGSGKSELLQSLVVSLAVRFHPHDLNFVLVDFKGGGMADALRDLPHLTGTITNLDGAMARRALIALKREILRRESVLGGQSVYEYQRRYRQGLVKEPIPHLVLIVDEFAELVRTQPDFIKELVSAATVGRSLGIHLLLATQKPGGMVSEQIWSNTQFRICLRVVQPGDSQDVLKVPDAAWLSRPGQGYLQVGNNDVFERFQSAWGGAPYLPDASDQESAEEVLEVALDGTRQSLRPSTKPAAVQAPQTQLQALVGYLAEMARQEGIKPLPGPWLPPLPATIALPVVPSAGWNGHEWRTSDSWLEPIIGLVDDPAGQFQGPLALNLGKEGHLAIYGGPGTGKTTLIRTLVSALATAHSPADVHIYLLDFGGRLLTGLANLPHVGGVVIAEEEERLMRLLRFLLREMEQRKERFAAAGVGTLPAYRSATGDRLPALVLLLDNSAAFSSQYPDAEEQLAKLAREGGNLGLHLVITAGSPMTVKSKISGNISLTVALNLVEPGDYGLAVGRTEGLYPAPLPGRGLVKGTPVREFQTAMPAAGADDAAMSAALGRLISRMAAAWSGPKAKPIPMLPPLVPLSGLLPPAEAWLEPSDSALAVPVGLEVNDLTPVAVDLQDGPHFLVTGTVQSGKSTFLQSWLLALAERFPPQRLQFCLVDLRHSGLFALGGLPQVRAVVEDADGLEALLGELEQELRERRRELTEARRKEGAGLDERALAARHPALVLAIDDLDAVRDQASPAAKDRLEQIVRRERGSGVHLLMAGAVADVNGSWEGWIKALKELQTGFLLGSNDPTDLSLFNLRLPLEEATRLMTPGLGYLAQRGKRRTVKVATAQSGSPGLTAWIEHLSQRATPAGAPLTAESHRSGG